MNDVLRDFLNVFVLVYLDDILVLSPDLSSHQQHVHQVLRRLLKSGLFIKAEKCAFHVTATSFLGLVISPGRIEMDPEKVQAVASWPTPSNRKELQSHV